jgi:hypothetical protein
VKRSKLSTLQSILGTTIQFNANDTLTAGSLTTTAVFRDPSKWYHIVVSNSGVYVDGVSYGTITTSALTNVGLSTTNFFDGYMAEVNFIDGTSLAATSFGSFDSNGNWGPAAYSGAYGTNGFHLDFSDSSNPGSDGNGGVTISSLSFQPDLVWIKSRSSALDHALFDSTQGVGKYISTNLTSAVTSLASSLKSFTSTGFTLGSAAITNTLSATYVAWNWKESATSGFDVVTYTGTGANRTVAHALGATPGMVMIKRTDTTQDWVFWHQNLSSPTTEYMDFNSVGSGVLTDATVWNSGAHTSANLSLGTSNLVNASGGSYIAYVWAEKPGFSKFGTYTGNSSTDGPFVYTGFSPKYIMVKKRGATYGWVTYDVSRETVNPRIKDIQWDLSNAENISGSDDVDILSNGFKIRNNKNEFNNSTNGSDYVYAAFADYPFERASVNNGTSIANSARFNGTNSHLDHTNGAAGNTKVFTYSGWIKRDTFTLGGTSRAFYGAYGSLSNAGYFAIGFPNGSDQLMVTGYSLEWRRSTAVFRDPSKWYHVVVAVDSTQATAADRMRVYVDGQEITSWSINNAIPLNQDFPVTAAMEQDIGYVNPAAGGAGYVSGYYSDIYVVDGLQLTPTSFGSFDTNGNWGPATYSGAFGTNGFHLAFGTAASPGLDTSGNGNNFTNNNIATTDNMYDSPTHNVATSTLFRRIRRSTLPLNQFLAPSHPAL